MGRLIELSDQDYQYCLDYSNGKTNIFALNNISRIIKTIADGTQYENRLKADLEAILVELQLEIEELDTPNNGSAYMDCVDIIQQKINALKEETT